MNKRIIFPVIYVACFCASLSVLDFAIHVNKADSLIIVFCFLFFIPLFSVFRWLNVLSSFALILLSLYVLKGYFGVELLPQKSYDLFLRVLTISLLFTLPILAVGGVKALVMGVKNSLNRKVY